LTLNYGKINTNTILDGAVKLTLNNVHIDLGPTEHSTLTKSYVRNLNSNVDIGRNIMFSKYCGYMLLCIRNVDIYSEK
jgi:hypothetical protein